MSQEVLHLIDQHFKQTPIPFSSILTLCREHNLEHLGKVLYKPTIRKIKMYCNWCDSKTLCKDWNKYFETDTDIQLVSDDKDDDIDYWVIINKPPSGSFYRPERTIVFQMEPNMNIQPLWGEFSNPDPSKFLKVCTHELEYNNMIWEISLNMNQLQNMVFDQKDKTISTILSSKYFDPGHKLRVDFIKFIENQIDVDVYGSNAFKYKNYLGPLPPYQKDQGLFPYKYTFNVENNFIKNYCTEKLIDAILSECLCFYKGPPNIQNLIDPRAYVLLDLEDFDKDMQTIKNAIKEDWWSTRIQFIKKEKQRILNDLQFNKRLVNIIENYEKKK